MDNKDKRAAPPSDDRGGEKKGDYKSTPTKGGGGRRDVSSLDDSLAVASSHAGGASDGIAMGITAFLKTRADFMNYIQGEEGAAKMPAAPEEDAKPSASGTGAAEMPNDGGVTPAWTSFINPDVNDDSRRLVVQKRRSLQDAVQFLTTYMQIKGGGHPLFDNLHSIAATALGRVWNDLPNNLMDMVREWSAAPTSGRSGNYLGWLGDVPSLLGPSNGRESEEPSMKTGESINLEYRVIERQRGEEGECFVIFLGEELTSLGFIAQSDVAEIMGLHLEILEGMDASRKGRIEEKVARQLAELIFHAAFEVKPGPVLEFLFLRPSAMVQKAAGVESMFEALEEATGLADVAGDLSNCNTVLDLDTWPPAGSVNEEERSLHLLLGDRTGCGVTPHQCKSTVDDGAYGGLANAHPTSPFLDEVDRTADCISEALQHDGELGRKTMKRIKKELGEVPKEWAFAPKDKQRYAATAMDRLEGALDNQPTNALIRMRCQTIEALRQHQKGRFDGLVEKEIPVRVLGKSIEETLYKTTSGHYIWARGSHYLMYAPDIGKTAKESFDIRLNAIQGLVGEGVLMYSMGLLGAASLHSLAKNMTSLAMLLDGLGGNGEGSWRDAMHYTVPKGVIAPSSVPGQKDLCVPFGFDLKQYQAVLRLLTQLERARFNSVLKALGSRLRIIEVGGKYLAGSRAEIDDTCFLIQYNQFDAATESNWLDPSYDLLKMLAGESVHAIVGGLLQTLFRDLERSNDPAQSRHNRLNALIQRVKSESGESAGRLLAILNDLPDMYVKRSSPDRWMKRFDALKDNMDESNLRAGETCVVRVHGKGEAKQKLDAIYKDWSSWIGLPECGTPVVGLKREMLEEIGVSFDVVAVTEAQQGKRTEDAQGGFRERLKQRKAATKQKRESGSK